MKNYVAITIFMAFTGLCQMNTVQASAYGGWDTKKALGIRLGWNGAPNGLTYRQVFSSGNAFEVVAGYNVKYGRHADIPAQRKGNSFIGVSYVPFFLMGDGDCGVAINGNFGARLNYHHYRRISTPEAGLKITPEVYAGFGLQVELNERVELFADLNLKYFSDPHNYYVPGMESGLGLRVVL